MRNLLCTFTQKDNLSITLDVIENTYELESQMIFVLSEVDSPEKLICTYNVAGYHELTENTIMIHRKSETSTLYTLNALNYIVTQLSHANNSETEFVEVNWNVYSNMLLLVSQGQLIKTRLALEKIINFKK